MSELASSAIASLCVFFFYEFDIIFFLYLKLSLQCKYLPRSGSLLDPVQLFQLLAGQLCIIRSVSQPLLISHAANIIILFFPNSLLLSSLVMSFIHLLRLEFLKLCLTISSPLSTISNESIACFSHSWLHVCPCVGCLTFNHAFVCLHSLKWSFPVDSQFPDLKAI